MVKHIKLGVVISSDGSQWTGGLEYYFNLFKAIKKADIENRIQITGLIASGVDQGRIQSLTAYLDEIHDIPKATYLEKAYEHVNYRKYTAPWMRFFKSSIEKKSSQLNLDIVFAPPYMVEYIQRPCITWIPDFQHVFIPQVFSQKEIANREYVFRMASDKADAVILSSETAFEHFTGLYPENVKKVHVLKFASQVPVEVFMVNPKNVIGRYSLPEKFYYLPNQFWQHKNHQVVLDAVEICVKKIPEIRVVCTGNLHESRDPTFPSKLFADISRKNIRENFIVLGLVEREEVYSLIRNCLALIQPSLFEGWSTTVEEAKSLGRPVILSNIPVHIEQKPEPGFYFDPLNPHQLADIMMEQWRQIAPIMDIDIENKAVQAAEKRSVEYGNKFIKCLEAVLD